MTTAIEWTDETWNPVTGCEKCSPGCDRCYIERTMPFRVAGRRFDERGRTDIQFHDGRLSQPLHWRKPRRVFVNSLSDLYHRDVPTEYIAKVVATAAAAERHVFQILTKRPQRMAKLTNDPAFIREVQRLWWAKWFILLDSPDRQPARREGDPDSRPLRIDNRRKRSIVWSDDRQTMPLGSSDLPWPPPNIWQGTSIENDTFTFRANHLRAANAAVRFVSLEPLLSDLPSLDLNGINWVIVGGESGPGARPMDPDWARNLRDRCVEAWVPFFFKQWGGRTPTAGGRLLDDRTWDQMP